MLNHGNWTWVLRTTGGQGGTSLTEQIGSGRFYAGTIRWPRRANTCSVRLPPWAFGFPFLLVHPDGEPAGPGMFLTAIPNWKVGDEFLAGSHLEKFRIVGVDTEQEPDGASGILTVQVIGED